MKTRLDEKNQENLEDKTLNIITERVDDIPLLIGMMIKMGMPEILVVTSIRVVLLNYALLSILKFHNPAANKIVKSFTNEI